MIGFAITLLIVSLEVPQTFDDLLTAVRGFAAFAISFAFILLIWHEHNLFFRRFGLQGSRVLILNSMLLFLILFYVYPLKFLITLTVNPLLGANMFVVSASGELLPMIRDEQVPLLFLLYALGWTALFSIFALFYQHALSHRVSLELSAVEVFLTRANMIEYALAAGLGVASTLLALTQPPAYLSFAGWIFLLMFPIDWLMKRWKQSRRTAIETAGEFS